jgi:hypothetical protein
MLEVGLPADTGEYAELARVRAPDRESRDNDEDAPRCAPALPGFLRSVLRVSPSCGRLAISGPSRSGCATIRSDWLGPENEDRNQWAVPRPGGQKAGK